METFFLSFLLKFLASHHHHQQHWQEVAGPPKGSWMEEINWKRNLVF
jgi:hypothetical protein